MDFTQVGKYTFNTECVTNGLLSKVLLMGTNGSGKSNLGYALFDIVYTLTDNASFPLQTEKTSFVNGESSSKEVVFKYEFQNGDRIIQYEYRKTGPMLLTYEKISLDKEVIFEMNHKNKKILKNKLTLINADKLRFDGLTGSLPLVRLIANNTIQEEDSPIRFIMDFVGRMLYFRSTQDGNMFIGLGNSGAKIEPYIVRNGLVDDFEEFLKKYAELNIKLGTIKLQGMQVPDILVQKFKGEKSLIFSDVASSGTKALELFYYWSRRFKEVSFLFIDEFDAFYHFELAEKIVRLLMDEYGDIQIVLTSHNTGIVSNKVMRPDCYLQIKDGTIISFSESTDRELREGHNLEKMLRNGEFE